MLAESDKGVLKGEIEAINMSASLMHVSVRSKNAYHHDE